MKRLLYIPITIILLFPTTAVGRNDHSRRNSARPYLTISRGEKAIVKSEIEYWKKEVPKEEVKLRVGGCKRISMNMVQCGIEITAVFFVNTNPTSILEHDNAILKNKKVYIKAI